MTTKELTRRARPRLNRKQVLKTALELIDREGLEALSMRTLGAALRVDPMTIYHHVGDKQRLLEGVAELLWEEVPLPEKPENLVQTLRTLARSIRRVFQDHPEAAPLILRCSMLSRTALEVFRAYLDALGNDKLGGRDAAAVLRPVMSYALGYGHAEISILGVQCALPDNQRLTDREQLIYLGQALPPDTPPRLAAAAVALIADCDIDQCFEDGLELMLAGLSKPAGNPRTA